MAIHWNKTDTAEPAFIVQAGDFGETAAYFDYTAVIRRIAAYLEARFGTAFRLYEQDDGCDLWDGLEEDIRSGFGGVEHAASLFDLVEARVFDYAEPDGSGEAERRKAFRPSVRNNLFVYPSYRVALARVPRIVQHGLGYEDLIFAEADAGLAAFMKEMRARRLADRQVILFTDTRDGLERERQPVTKPVTRNDVFLDEGLKTQIYRSIDEFFAGDRAFFQTYGIPYKRGILLYGKPGNGKTTLVKSIASTVGSPVAYWQITEFTGSESIQEVFAAAVNMAPMVLVIEDIDSMPDACRSYFLNTLDGAASKEGIYLIGTTNHPEKIDPALMNRAGRFDRAYEVRLPDEPLRRAYLLYKGMDRLAGTGAADLAARTSEGFSLAQLGELYVSAALQLHYDGTADVERLIAEMQADYAKGRSREWMSDEASRRMGFR